MRLRFGRWTAFMGLALYIVGPGAPSPASATLATMNLSTSSGKPGSTITLTGVSFAVPRPGVAALAEVPPTPVVIRWHGEDGPILAATIPDRYGSISATVTIPSADPGTYVIVGTQLTPRLVPGAPADQAPMLLAEPGTPARSSFKVLGADGSAPRVAAPVVSEPLVPTGELDSTVWIVLTASIGAVAMSLFGGGLIAFVYQSRKSREPAAAHWVPPGWQLPSRR